MAGTETCEGGGDVVSGEEEDVGRQMKARVEEGVETEEATEADQERERWREATDGRYSERDEEEVEGPVAGEVSNVVDWIGVVGECV